MGDVAVAGHQPLEVRRRQVRVAELGVQQVHVDAVAGAPDLVELVGEDLVLGALRVVQERDPAAVGAALQRAQHRHHRGDAGAAGDEQRRARARGPGSDEVALGLGQVDHRAGPGPLDEVARDARRRGWRAG